MDFNQLILEYQFKTQNKKKGSLWWKDEKWNKPKRVTNPNVIERSFAKQDFILAISSEWETSFQWLLQNEVLKTAPPCPTCQGVMELSPLGSVVGQGNKSDLRMYRCRLCLTRESVRHGSHIFSVPFTLQEFVRVIFYYFIKGYEPELAQREMTDNTAVSEKQTVQIKLSNVHQQYSRARDRISRYQIYSVTTKKFGGVDQDVSVDILKLVLRQKNNKNEEYIIIGFLETATKRARCYLAPNCKAQTVVQFIAKTVARGSNLYTPFYTETGWEFLDKYFKHKRLVTEKGKSYEYCKEAQTYRKSAGFEPLWKHIRSLESTWLRLMHAYRKYGDIQENLQMHIDEQVWRATHSSLNELRESLLLIYTTPLEAHLEKSVGIGGGYGQFGILTEHEFNLTLRTEGKRLRKFTEHEDQFKKKDGNQMYPQKQTLQIVTEGDELKERMGQRIEYRTDLNCYDDCERGLKFKNAFYQQDVDVLQVARRRFGYSSQDFHKDKGQNGGVVENGKVSKNCDQSEKKQTQIDDLI